MTDRSMGRLLHEPLLHFFLLGALLYAVQPLWTEQLRPWLSPETIEISQTDIEQLKLQWSLDTRQQPNDKQLRALINQHIDSELLYREALKLGLQYGDPVIAMRLSRNIRFIDPDTTASDQERLEQAYQLGMLDSDLVTRRRLIQKLQHQIESISAVTEEEVQSHIRENAADYQLPARYSFKQLYFADKESAEDAYQQLQKQPNANIQGEVFLHPAEQSRLSAKEIQARFGRQIADSIPQQTEDTWSMPLPSVYGYHLTKTTAVTAARSSEYSEARSPALAAVYTQRDSEILRAYLDKLRKRYRVVIEGRST